MVDQRTTRVSVRWSMSFKQNVFGIGIAEPCTTATIGTPFPHLLLRGMKSPRTFQKISATIGSIKVPAPDPTESALTNMITSTEEPTKAKVKARARKASEAKVTNLGEIDVQVAIWNDNTNDADEVIAANDVDAVTAESVEDEGTPVLHFEDTLSDARVQHPVDAKTPRYAGTT